LREQATGAASANAIGSKLDERKVQTAAAGGHTFK
jgi:hypothetical protein